MRPHHQRAPCIEMFVTNAYLLLPRGVMQRSPPDIRRDMLRRRVFLLSSLEVSHGRAGGGLGVAVRSTPWWWCTLCASFLLLRLGLSLWKKAKKF